jgi:glutamate 5-kinase
VTYTVTDQAGNSASCSFTVTVKTVTQTIKDLKTSVNNSSLDPPTKGGLVAKLQAAEDALAAGHTNTACQKLADFVNSTQNLIDHGNISAATGNAWISTATHLRNAIGCTNNPCS